MHGVKQAKLLAPFAESHFCFDPKNTLDGALARSAIAGEFFEWPPVGGIGEESLYYTQGSRVGGMRQLERDGVSGFQLINQDFDNAAMQGSLFV